MSDLMYMQYQGAADVDPSSTSIMDSGDHCRICFSFKTHSTSRCPFLDKKDGFVEARNRNFVSLQKIRKEARVGQQSAGNKGNDARNLGFRRGERVGRNYGGEKGGQQYRRGATQGN